MFARSQMGVAAVDYEVSPIFNSMTEKRNNVQLRTGLFEVYVPLPKVVGNLGFGPEVDMSLFYTPVVNNLDALGDGWSFAFTTYHESTLRLTLHSGEVLGVEKGKDMTSAAVIARWKDGGSTLEVERKDGRVETLKKQGESDLWKPVRLTADGYRYLALTWTVVSQGGLFKTDYQVRLLNIRNDTPAADDDPAAVKAEAKRQLFSAVYNTEEVTLTFWGGSDEELKYTLSIKDVALRSVTPPEGPGWASKFDYIDDPECGWVLNKIVTFDGLTESVEYVPETRSFKDDQKLRMLPCVSKHTMKPRAGGKDIVTTYTYGENVKGDVTTYTTTVTDLGVSGDRTTVYVYDNRFAMVSETTTRGSTVVERTFEDKEFDLVETCSSKAAETRLSWLDSGVRCEATLSYYRDSTLLAIDSKGVSTAFDFEGEGRFSDAYLVNEAHLSSETLKDDVDMDSEHYITDREHLDDWVDRIMRFSASRRSIEYQGIERINRKKPVYIRTQFGGRLVGQEITYFTEGYRKGLKKTVRQGAETGEQLGEDAILTSYDYRIDGTSMTTTAIESRGTETRSRSTTVSILSGRCPGEIDVAGNVASYAYDGQGRLTSRTLCKGTIYSEVTTYAYPSVGRVEIVEPDGRKRAVESDGRDNVVKEEVHDGTRWVVVLAAEYDDMGRKERVIKHDVADGVAISAICVFGYDSWGRECSRVYGDGRAEFDQFDPVFLVREEWEGKQADLHRKRTFYRPDEQIAYIRWLDATGKAWQGHDYLYSANTCRGIAKSNDDGSELLIYGHDAFGRVSHVGRTLGVKRDLSAMPRRISGKDDIDPAAWPGAGLADQAARLQDQTVYYTYRSDDVLDTEPAEILFTEGDWVKHPVGSRAFDAWGRVTSIVRAGVTETMTYDGSSPVPKTVKRGDGSLLNYEYIKELGYKPSKVTGSGANAGKSKTFSYAHGKTKQSAAKEDPTSLGFTLDAHMRPIGEKASMDGKTSRETTQIWSEGGRLVSATDVLGGAITYTYNAKGQRVGTKRGADMQTSHVYNEQGLLASEDVAYGADKAKVSYAYDAMYRETSRTFTLPGTVLALAREYDSAGRVTSASLVEGKTVLGSKAYAYDAGGRLASCTMTGVWRAKSPKGKLIDKQSFTYDGLGNVVGRVTRFESAVCNSTYAYDDSGFRLVTVTHDHDDYKIGGKLSVTLTYDACGRLTRDAYGKTYEYDWLGRLVRAGSRHYAYDAMNRLMACGTATEKRQLVFDGMQLCGEHGSGDTGRYFFAGSAACSVQRVKLGDVDRILFELRDADGTVLVSYDRTAGTLKHHAYTAYGDHDSGESGSLLGFQGAYREAEAASADAPAVDRYPLGQGYRWYEPGGMRFNAPDSESPYGVGGLNAYGYCDGDPVNFQDPSGHGFFQGVADAFRKIIYYTPLGLSQRLRDDTPDWQRKFVKINEAVFLATAGVAGAVFTGGVSLLLFAAVTTLAVVSAATAVASVALEDSDPEAADILGWISLGTGLAGSGVRYGPKFAPKAMSMFRQGVRWISGLAKGGMRAGVRRAIEGSRRLVAYALRGGSSVGDDLLGNIPRATNAIVDDALGALPNARGLLIPPARGPLLRRLINFLQPYIGSRDLLSVPGGLLSAADFLDEHVNSRAADG